MEFVRFIMLAFARRIGEYAAPPRARREQRIVIDEVSAPTTASEDPARAMRAAAEV
jgi:hypothetical protein